MPKFPIPGMVSHLLIGSYVQLESCLLPTGYGWHYVFNEENSKLSGDGNLERLLEYVGEMIKMHV